MADLLVNDLVVERDGRLVLDRCSARFAAGRRTVLWGSSGSGKSTLLSTIAGLLRPRSGTIALGEQVLFSSAAGIDLPPHQRRIGFVFQDLALWPHLTAGEHVCLVGHSAGLTKAQAHDVLASVGLERFGQRRPGQLSGGEQQRLAIARALAGQPSMLLLDEPFSSVDRAARKALYALLSDVSPRIPGPTIYVTHQSEDATALAEAVVTLEGGSLAPGERPWEAEC